MTGNKWVDGVVLVAAVLTALGVIYAKAIRPFFRFGKTLGKAADQAVEAFPILIDVAEHWEQMTVAVTELTEYSHSVQHQNVNTMTVMNLRALKTDQAVESIRTDIALLTDTVADMSASVTMNGSTVDRIEAAGKIVASDLSDSHDRADAAGSAHGQAADAASRSEPSTKE